MATLYGCYRSRATRPLWLAEETGQALDLHPVIQAYRLPDAGAADAPFNTRSPAFLALSPAGAVPVLQDGDLVLAESAAITLHLARKWGGDCAPRDAAEDALMQQWALYGATAVEPASLAIMGAFRDGRQATGEGMAEIARHHAALERPLRVLEAHLAAQGHLVGGRFTAADINMAEMLRYGATDAALLAPYPAVQGWLAACQARPGFRAMWARRQAEPE